jgi:prefoldin subunit 5
MSKAVELLSKQYETFCQQLGDLEYKRYQIDREIIKLRQKIEALNESLPTIRSMESQLNETKGEK